MARAEARDAVPVSGSPAPIARKGVAGLGWECWLPMIDRRWIAEVDSIVWVVGGGVRRRAAMGGVQGRCGCPGDGAADRRAGEPVGVWRARNYG